MENNNIELVEVTRENIDKLRGNNVIEFDKNKEFINLLNENTILEDNTFKRILDIKNKYERTRTQSDVEKKAKNLGVEKNFKKFYKAYEEDQKSKARINFQSNFKKWYAYDCYGDKEDFLPKILANKMLEDIKLIYAGYEYYIYKNGVYKQTQESNINKLIVNKYLDDDAKPSQVEQTKYMIMSEKTLKLEEINADDNIINCKNCMLVVTENNELKKISHDPKIIRTTQINAKLKEAKEVKIDKFQEFLNDVFEEKDIDTVQEMFGYCLTSTIKAQKFFLLTGEAGCGKSVVLNIIQYLLGEENVSNVRLQDLADRFKTACLIGKSANIFADIDSKTPLEDSSILKALTGEDRITVEKKGKDPQEFKNKAKCLFSCNGLPRINDTSNGVYRRLILLQCKEPKSEDKRNPNLLNELIEEMDGIFRWALAGLKRLIKNDYKFTISETSKKIINDYKARNNNVMAFVEDNCSVVASNEKYIECQKLYDIYKNYCSDNGFMPMSSKSFTIELEKNYKNISKTRKRNNENKLIHAYIGIDLNHFK